MKKVRRALSRHQVAVFAAALTTFALGLGGAALAAGDANQETCPAETVASAGYRTYLPDCRAYELVTPPFKDGALIRRLPDFQFASIDGARVLGTSYGGFAGTGNDEENVEPITVAATYVFSRTPTGWTAEAIAPPAAAASHASFIAASADLSRTLWAVSEQPQPREELLGEPPYQLALREHADGEAARFVPVGPEDPPPGSQRNFTFEGASADLSHIVFSIQAGENELWPGDATEKGPSLYEYAGAHQTEPALVGVTNGAALHGSPHVNDGADLVSKCGTELGGGNRGSEFNAVSTTGEVVYFTALHQGCATPAVDELYARRGGTQTIPISEFKSAECTGSCATSEAKSAIFQGASEDGTRVFFTTAQPLLNSDHDQTNDLYMAELGEAGVTQLVQISHGGAGDSTPGAGADVIGVARISRDATRVYFVAQGVLTSAANGDGETPERGAFNLYLYDTQAGATAFVAKLVTHPEIQAACIAEPEGTAREACEARVAEELAESQSPVAGIGPIGLTRADFRPFDTTTNGRFLAFLSRRDLTGAEDTSTVNQVFRYDATTGALVRVSRGQVTSQAPGGYNDNGNTSAGEDAARIVFPRYNEMFPTEQASGQSVAEDGSVFFTSRTALVPGAVEGSRNLYEYDGANVYLIAPGGDRLLEDAVFGDGTEPDEEAGRFLGIDPSGNQVFFTSAESLLPQDTDTQADWYVARVDGGTPAPAQTSTCGMEACQGRLAEAPRLLTPTSTASVSGGNLPPPLPTANGSKRLSRARQLARALKKCKSLARPKRRHCQAAARRKYAGRRSTR